MANGMRRSLRGAGKEFCQSSDLKERRFTRCYVDEVCTPKGKAITGDERQEIQRLKANGVKMEKEEKLTLGALKVCTPQNLIL